MRNRLLKRMRQDTNIVQPRSCISITLPCSSTCATTSLPSIHNVGHASIVILKYSPVIQLLLCVWSIQRIGNMSVVHLGISNFCSYLSLKHRYPIFTNTFALHCLGTPEDGTRYTVTIFVWTFKHISQISLFASGRVRLHCLFVNNLESRINAHGHLCELCVKEWNTSLQCMCHCHTICSVKIDITKHTVNPSKLILYLSGVFCVHEVKVSCKELIGSLAS
mmetsp:Transcript_8817/g.11717  ORF Transcript_8817/g.11717 Transcript_8817/m.11717 type:complete len:221 (+) Transcript_8817:93-755(+)